MSKGLNGLLKSSSSDDKEESLFENPLPKMQSDLDSPTNDNPPKD